MQTDFVNDTINLFSLNNEQARAFRIIAHRAINQHAPPLRMFLGGPGGTGKSRVIHAVQHLFRLRNEHRRFRLASFMGVAAKNIAGMTLHTALALGRSAKPSDHAKPELVSMWEGVDFLLIDEVSMIGCNFLLTISQALSEAKNNCSPFGNINIIFAGDFAQLPPVGQRSLYAKMHVGSASARRENTLLGKLLWLTVDTVVLLTTIVRQQGVGNEHFKDLLNRLRDGRCTQEDFDLLNSRLISSVHPCWNDHQWANAPIIVSSNELKDALNVKCVESYAIRTTHPFHSYVACDRHGGHEINVPELQTHLRFLHSGISHNRLGNLPLSIGMPVMITQNLDVDSGIVNSSVGVLRTVRYKTTNSGDRVATSCVVSIDNMKNSPLPQLEHGEVPVLPDDTEMTFTHPFSGKKTTIHRSQLPLLPAFAMTAHKAQGQTLPNAIVDLEGCKGTEAPYVMLSRVRSLDDLLILRPFSFKRITCRPSEDRRTEEKRLHILDLHTTSQYGSMTEKTRAHEQLQHVTPCDPSSLTVSSSRVHTSPTTECTDYNPLLGSVQSAMDAVDHNEPSTSPSKRKAPSVRAVANKRRRQ